MLARAIEPRALARVLRERQIEYFFPIEQNTSKMNAFTLKVQRLLDDLLDIDTALEEYSKSELSDEDVEWVDGLKEKKARIIEELNSLVA